MPTTPTPGHERPSRGRQAEGQRNRETLLTAARQVFAERGVRAPLDDVARLAGLGNATLYRHFPSRRELIIAVYAEEVTALCAEGDALLADQDPVDALLRWLRAFVGHVATKRELALAIPADQDPQRSTLFDTWHAAMRATAVRLLARTRPSTAWDVELAAADLLAMAGGIALSSTDDEQAERCLRIVCRGVFPHG